MEVASDLIPTVRSRLTPERDIMWGRITPQYKMSISLIQSLIPSCNDVSTNSLFPKYTLTYHATS